MKTVKFFKKAAAWIRKPGVPVTSELLDSLVAIGDNVSSGAVVALVAHFYFGDGDNAIDFVLFICFAAVLITTVWLRSKKN